MKPARPVAYGGMVRIIACIEDAEVIEQILTHLDAKTAEPESARRPPSRRLLFDRAGLPDDKCRGCAAIGTATVAAGQRVGVLRQRAPANPSPGWMRAL